MTKTVTVYGLASGEDGQVRYVGQTVRPLLDRLRGHTHEAKRFPNRALSRWLHATAAAGFEITITPIVSGAIWSVTECEVILEYLADGIDLVNGTAGGDGAVGRVFAHTPESRAKISVALKGRKISDEQRRRRSEIMKTWPRYNFHNELARTRAAESRKGKIPANLAAIHQSMIGKPKPAEMKKKIAASLTGRKASDETKAKRSASLKAYLASHPEALERRRLTLAAIHAQHREAA